MDDVRLSLETFLPYRLAYTASLVSQVVARTYEAQFGLTIPQWRLIAHVAESQGLTQQDVVARSRMDKVTVSRAAIALTRRGLIRRQSNPSDRRSRLLVLTPAGESLYAEIAPRALALERAMFGGFSPEEKHALMATLRRVEAAALAARQP
jgi:DNA-binding MarR family transcriptional regulator